MKRSVRLFSSLVLAVIVIASCQTAPQSGRQQFILISDEQANALGVEAYRDILANSRISRDRPKAATVDRVGRRIATAADHPDFAWEFTLIEDPAPNAFALPGGKVGVHTGLFTVAGNEAQLAAVMGHEIAHAVARHSAERMSRQLAIQAGLSIAGASSATLARYAPLVAQMATLALILPFSRNQESEADEIGLIYMARAGYDPREAIALWRNFDKLDDKRPPAFLSTHPAPQSRIARLRQAMPRAMKIYNARR